MHFHCKFKWMLQVHPYACKPFKVFAITSFDPYFDLRVTKSKPSLTSQKPKVHCKIYSYICSKLVVIGYLSNYFVLKCHTDSFSYYFPKRFFFFYFSINCVIFLFSKLGIDLELLTIWWVFIVIVTIVWNLANVWK